MLKILLLDHQHLTALCARIDAFGQCTINVTFVTRNEKWYSQQIKSMQKMLVDT